MNECRPWIDRAVITITSHRRTLMAVAAMFSR
jgi:hypothetical protein